MNYGFSDQGLPTYAEANFGGKTRFLPINLLESVIDDKTITFSDDKGWRILGRYLQLDNDHHSHVFIYPDAKTEYACDVVGTKRIKG